MDSCRSRRAKRRREERDSRRPPKPKIQKRPNRRLRRLYASQFARPTGDVDVSGWANQSGGLSNLYTSIDEISHSESDYITRTLVGPKSGEPPRTVVLLLDDGCDDDFYGVIPSGWSWRNGTRAGEPCTKQIQEQIIAKARYFPYTYVSNSVCGPARAEFFTAEQYHNHLVANDPATYAYFMHDGKLGPRPWAGDTPLSADVLQSSGPWEVDYAGKYGLPTYPVPGGAAQLKPGDSFGGWPGGFRSRTFFGPADANDDVQAFTSSLAPELEKGGVTPIYSGKYHNGVGFAEGLEQHDPVPGDTTSRRVPPGWKHWFVQTGSTPPSGWGGSINDRHNTRACDYSGPNPGSGDGAVGTEVFYQYSFQIISINASGGQATVTCNEVIGYETNPWSELPRVCDLKVGDEIDIVGVTPDAYNGTWTISELPGTHGLTTSQLRFAIPGTPSEGICTVPDTRMGVRHFYSDMLFTDKLIEKLELVEDDEPWFAMLGFENPHQSTGDVSLPANSEREYRYDGCIAEDDRYGSSQAFNWAGGPGCTYYIQNLTWSAGVATVTLFDPVTDLQPGDRINLSGTPSDEYVGWWNVDTVISGTVFTFLMPTTPIDNPARLNTAFNNKATIIQVRKYTSPAIPDSEFPILRSHRRFLYGQRHEMLCTVDDCVGKLINYFAIKGWTNVRIILWSDNGYDVGDHADLEGSDAWSLMGGKRWLWNHNIQISLFIVDPEMTQGPGPWRSDFNVIVADLAPTILDFYSDWIPSFAQHHMHSKRDGYSIRRLFRNPDDPVHQRGILILGIYCQVINCAALITPWHEKILISPYTGSYARQTRLYDVTKTILPDFQGDPGENHRKYSDWETNDLATFDAYGFPTGRTQVLYDHLRERMAHSRWSVSLGRNRARDPVPAP